MSPRDKIFYVHVSVAVVIGLICGSLKLDPAYSIFTFATFYLLSSQLLIRRVDLKKLPSPSKIFTEGVFSSILIFFLFWIMSFNLVGAYQPVIIRVSPEVSEGIGLIENPCIRYPKNNLVNAFQVIEKGKDNGSYVVLTLGLFKEWGDSTENVYLTPREWLTFNKTSLSVFFNEKQGLRLNKTIKVPWTTGNYSIVITKQDEKRKCTVYCGSTPTTEFLIEQVPFEKTVEIYVDKNTSIHLVFQMINNEECVFKSPAYSGPEVNLSKVGLHFVNVGDYVLINESSVYVALTEKVKVYSGDTGVFYLKGTPNIPKAYVHFEKT